LWAGNLFDMTTAKKASSTEAGPFVYRGAGRKNHQHLTEAQKYCITEVCGRLQHAEANKSARMQSIVSHAHADVSMIAHHANSYGYYVEGLISQKWQNAQSKPLPKISLIMLRDFTTNWNWERSCFELEPLAHTHPHTHTISQACLIQRCLANNNHIEEKCQVAVNFWKECVDRHDRRLTKAKQNSEKE